jgi:beta-N-acetylhexosaminidase
VGFAGYNSRKKQLIGVNVSMNELGQLFTTGISGLVLTEEEKDFIQKNNIGGVILFANNYKDPTQLAELVNEIQTLRDEYPLFISVDQEGGRVKRFKSDFTQFPAMFDVGQLESPKLTFEVHKQMAEELNACGVNLNYSPCCDVWTNPENKVIGDRSFGTKAQEVEKHVSAAIRGLHTGNVLACAKHFPGHGNTLKDSHFDLPFVNKTMDELEQVELVPFVKASKSRVEFVMMAHLVVEAIDKELPCTLSKPAYDFLRNYLKYKNLIVTDDMEMKAIEDNYSCEKAAIMAIGAGADILLYRSLESTQKAYEAVKEAIRLQNIKKVLIEEKTKRVKDCKKNHFAEYTPIYIPSIEKIINSEQSQKILDQLTKTE